MTSRKNMLELSSRILDLAVAIQQIPAPTFLERERAEFVRARFTAEGLAEVEIDSVGNVYACLKGQHGQPASGQPPLVVSAHLDTVFPPSVDLTIGREADRIAGPGIGDNSLGVAALVGLAWALGERQVDLPGDLWLVANVCEEGLGDLRGMKAVVERFGDRPLAYIILEGMALGQVYHRGLGVRRYRISARTPGGHSWIDYGRPSAVHELATLATRLTGLKVPSRPRTTLNVGIITGGTSVNTIAAEAALELDLRSEESEVLEELAAQVEQICRLAKRQDVEIDCEVIGSRPAGEIPGEHPLVRLAEEAIRAVGYEPRRNIGSTDANIPLSRGLPAVTIGLSQGAGAHTVHEYVQTGPLEKGIEQVVKLVKGVWGLSIGE
ncbi:MAG: M20/M25/M40 family metallo-hydrolase [Anaerolineales bacterium]|nr:M20/M25/M40 family metallo-hydrolase [Anaerolineales bacterium]